VQAKVSAGTHVQEAEGLLREAKDLMTHGKYREALSRLERILKLLPGNDHARAMRDECRRKIDQADQVTVLLRQGTALYDKGKFKEARDVLQTVLTVDPAQHEATRFLEKANDNLERDERIEKLIADAEISLKHDKFDAALSAFQRVLTLDPENKDAQRGLKKAERTKADAPNRQATPPPGLPRPSRRRSYWSLLAAGVIVIAGAVTFVLLQKPPQSQTATPANITVESKPDLTGPAIDARNAMLGQRATAESAGAPALAKDPFGQAVALQQKGEREFDAGSLESARNTFEESERLFRKAKDEAVNSTAVSADKGRPSQDRETVQPPRTSYLAAPEASKSSADEAGRIAGLKREADKLLAAMAQTKAGLPGGDADRRASAKFRAGQDAESSARTLYQSQKYPEAADAFARAKSLYADASGEISSALAEAKTASPPAESKPAEPKSAESKDAAKRDREERDVSLRKTLESYRKSFEEGDIQTVATIRNLSGDAAKSYNEFFKSTDNRTMTIGPVILQPDLMHARAELTQRFSNKDHGDEPQTLSLVSNLEFVNGRWTITSFSRK
jgi:tetratricopeptide (TPR) repeat protein